jgi:nuclear transport factor 2 (NTF2) superfamily protein
MRFLTGLGQALRCLVLLLACACWPAQAADIISPPQFSHEAGFHPYTFKLKLYHPDAGVSIFYTLDGSTPYVQFPYERSFQYKTAYRRSPRSKDGVLEKGRLVTLPYRGPIKLSRVLSGAGRYARIPTSYGDQPVAHLPPAPPGADPYGLQRVWDEFLEYSRNGIDAWAGADPAQALVHPRASDGQVDRAVVVRAVAVGPRGERSHVVTRSFFFGNPARFNLPVVVLTADPEDLFGHEQGVLVAGRRFDAWRERHPHHTATAGTADANWRDEGDSSERAVHVEYLGMENGRLQSQPAAQSAGLRVHGAFSRAATNKSMRLHARKRYGQDDMDVFGSMDRPFPAKQVILRNAGNDRTGALFRDAVLHRVMDGLHLEVSRSRPVSVFVNGEYWGLFNLRERLGDDHFAGLAGVKDSDIELSRNYGVSEEQPGMATEWLDLIGRIEAATAAGRPAGPVAEAEMDLASYIDLHIAQIYVGNIDWPFNNMQAWRVRPSASVPPRAQAHRKWHWPANDMDASFHVPGTPKLTDMLSDQGPRGRPDLAWSTRLFRALMKDPAVRARFLQRYVDLLNTRFAPERVHRFVDQYRGEIATEVPHHINRWRVPADVAAWERSVRHVKGFASQRVGAQLAEFQSLFGLEAPVAIQLGPLVPGAVLQVNGMRHEGDPSQPVTLRYFKGMALKIEVLEGPCRRVQGWHGQGVRAASLDLVVDQPLVLRPVLGPSCEPAGTAARPQGS